MELDLTKLDVSVLRLKPGDKLAITLPAFVSPTAIKSIREQMDKFAPGVPCLLLRDGMELSVVEVTNSQSIEPEFTIAEVPHA